MSSTDTQTTLTADEGHLLRVAFDKLPYSGMLPGLAHGKQDEEITVADVAAHLAYFRDELLRASARAEQTERELRTLQGQRDALRAFLGTDGSAA